MVYLLASMNPIIIAAPPDLSYGSQNPKVEETSNDFLKIGWFDFTAVLQMPISTVL